jgi:hypothetical protein
MGATDLAQSYKLFDERTVAQSTIANFVLLILNLFGIGYVYQRVVRLIRPGHSIDLVSSLLKSSLQSSIHQQILNALGERVLNQKARMYGFDYSPGLPRQGSPVEVEYGIGRQSLRVVDVDLNKLRDLSNFLDRPNSARPKGWVRARPGSTLSPSDSVVGYLPADSNDFTQDKLQSCYVVKENDEGKTEWEESVENLRSRATRAVEERKPSELSEYLEVYEDVLRHYAIHIEGYSPDVIATAFDGLMSGYWRPDSVLRREVRNLGRRAILADDRDLVESMLYLPIRVLRTARTERRLDLFKRFAKLYLSFYEDAQGLPPDSTSREYIVDRCWRHLRDFVNWVSFKSFDRVSRPLDIKQDASYAATALEVFSSLIKRTLNHKDYDSFRTFVDGFDDLLRDLPSTRTKLRSGRRRIERKTDKQDDQSPKTLYATQALAEAEDAVEELLELKMTVRFGLAAWLLDLYKRGELERDQAQRFIAKLASHFKDLEELHDIYLGTREKEWEETFNWTMWDGERHEEGFGEARAVTTRTWLRRFYVVKGLELVKPEEVRKIDLAPSMQIKVEFDDIQSTCEEISKQGHPFRDFDDLDKRIETFLNLLKRAKERQERREADHLIEADISHDHVASFEKSFREGWRGMNLDRLIEPFVSVEKFAEGEGNGTSESFSLKDFTDKTPFTSTSPDEVVPRLGERMGRDLGRAERARFFQKLRESASTEVISKEKFGELLEREVQERETDLLLAGSNTIAHHLLHIDEFVPSWIGENHPYSDLPGYEGRLGNVPLCTVFEDSDAVVGVALDGSVQVKRVQQENGELLTVEIEQVDDDKVANLLNGDIDLDDFESEREAIRFMKQRVLLYVREDIRFEFGEGRIGFELVIDKER